MVSPWTRVLCAQDCSQSRLWGGVHFPETLNATINMCRGLGAAAFERVQVGCLWLMHALCGFESTESEHVACAKCRKS